MTKTIYLVRHGMHALVDRVLCGRSDPAPLAPEGVAQANRLAALLADKKIDLIQSSPRRRTRETAAPIARRLWLRVQNADDMDELDTGEWTGQSFAILDRDPKWRAWNEHRGLARPPGGESMCELQVRVVHHIEQLRTDGVFATVIVTHAEPIRAALLHYRKMPLDRFSEIEVAPGSISILRDDGSGMDARDANLMELS